jgi:hypothetical protein
LGGNVDAGITAYMVGRDHIENESEEFKQGYIEGFKKGYWDTFLR